MRDNGVIEGLVQIALFLAAVSSYAYLMWRRKFLTSTVAGPRYVPSTYAIQRSTLFLSTQKSSSPVDQRGGGIAGSASPKSKFSAAGDWLVPVIVWVLVILMTLAIVGFLLGDR
jgi:hypothetical protein